MGEVYLAEDTQLGRRVAIKLLPLETISDEQARKRLIREARAAATLDHPHICSVYEVGEADGRNFIAMQYVEGETLDAKLKRKPLELKEYLSIASQVADALSEAHAHGIIHRDIKPSNIIITSRGQAKVMDFGLARMTTGAIESEANTQSLLTAPGTVLGTMPYMSPEQVRGVPVDARTDIFSFGVMLYEMLSGRQPFTSESAAATASAILTHNPPPLARFAPEAPEELQRIVRKCLEKDREQRYQSARDLLIDLSNLKRGSESAAFVNTKTVSQPQGKLRRIAIVAVAAMMLALACLGFYLLAGREKSIDSLAVLPLVNAGADPNTEYLSDGISESLINRLSQLPKLRVKSRDSAFRYKGRQADAQTVGRELGVSAVLAGRVVPHGNDLSTSVELVDARDGNQIWGAQYNRRLTDLLALQEEMAKEIAEKLRLRLTGEEQKQLAKRATENPEAYQLYLKGRYFWSKRTLEGTKRGQEYFKQAIDLDPAYAPAYAGVADMSVTLGSYILGAIPPREAWAGAEAAAKQALKLDDTLAEAHSTLAWMNMNFKWDWPEAEKELKRAIELKPDDKEVYHRYAHYLMYVGRKEEALTASQRALALDPLDLSLNAHLGWHYLNTRQSDQAVDQMLKTVEMDPTYALAHWYLGLAYEQRGMFAEAIEEFQKAVALSQRNPTYLASLGHGYAMAGQGAEARKLLQELRELSKQRYVLPYCFAVIHAGLGEKDEAFAYLEKGYQERDSWLNQLKVEPRLDGLRSDPRFADLVRRVGLPQ